MFKKEKKKKKKNTNNKSNSPGAYNGKIQTIIKKVKKNLKGIKLKDQQANFTKLQDILNMFFQYKNPK